LEDERDSERKGKTGNDVSELQELPWTWDEPKACSKKNLSA
jgi:hypothetical protein